jgi:hypothetical protein
MTRDKIISFFENLLSKRKVNDIIENNWVSFDYYNKTYTINFREKDGKNDTVIFCSVNYNQVTEKWYSSNCIDYPYIEFDSFDDMSSHLSDIEDEIMANGFNTIEI